MSPKLPCRPSRRAAPTLPDALRAARRVAVLGVGSELRGDDVAGVAVARRLRAWRARTGCRRLAAFDGASAPENLTGEIARFAPDYLVLVDAAYLGREPGAVAIVPAESIGGASLSTHTLPVPIILGYLARTVGCRALVLAIQLEQTEVLARPSPAVARAIRRVAGAFERAFGSP